MTIKPIPAPSSFVERVGLFFTVRWLWCVDFLCGPDGRPSSPRLMSWAIYAAYIAQRPIPATICAMLLAASFGYKAFKDWLDKTTFAVTHADTIALGLTKATTTQITETVQQVASKETTT